MEDESNLEAGQRLTDRYRLLEPLGSGGFGTVWKAHDEAHGRDVALKVLHPGLLVARGMRARFAQEAEILQRIRHEHVVRVEGLVDDGHRLFIVMEYLPGRALNLFLAERSRNRELVSLEDVVTIVDQVCMGLSAAHRIKAIHRDLKPANVHLVSETPLYLKLLDFGVAKLLGSEDSDQTTRGRQVGSYAYMAPEQITGGPTDARTDVFSLATLAFEALTLKRAWRVTTSSSHGVGSKEGSIHAAMELCNRICSGPRFKVTDYRNALRPECDAVIAHAWATRVSDRPANVWLFRDMLVSALGVDRKSPRPEDDLDELPGPDTDDVTRSDEHVLSVGGFPTASEGARRSPETSSSSGSRAARQSFTSSSSAMSVRPLSDAHVPAFVAPDVVGSSGVLEQSAAALRSTRSNRALAVVFVGLAMAVVLLASWVQRLEREASGLASAPVAAPRQGALAPALGVAPDRPTPSAPPAPDEVGTSPTDSPKASASSIVASPAPAPVPASPAAEAVTEPQRPAPRTEQGARATAATRSTAQERRRVPAPPGTRGRQGAPPGRLEVVDGVPIVQDIDF